MIQAREMVHQILKHSSQCNSLANALQNCYPELQRFENFQGGTHATFSFLGI